MKDLLLSAKDLFVAGSRVWSAKSLSGGWANVRVSAAGIAAECPPPRGLYKVGQEHNKGVANSRKCPQLGLWLSQMRTCVMSCWTLTPIRDMSAGALAAAKVAVGISALTPSICP
jgi:hypothetical protein